MFTSRAEFRLQLRHDNADFRLARKGADLGLISPEQAEAVEAESCRVEETVQRLHKTSVETKSLHEILRAPGASWEDVESVRPETSDWSLSDSLKERVRIAVRYEHYIERQQDEVERMRRQEQWLIPDDFDYEAISGLRSEAREKLQRLRPDSIGSAQRIAGVSPADISCLLVVLRTGPKQGAID